MVNKNEEIKIVVKGNRKITRKGLFKKKELFHKRLAKIPFEQKIRILVRLQEIADSIKKKQRAWKNFSKSWDEGIRNHLKHEDRSSTL
jgi:hypothetical protein